MSPEVAGPGPVPPGPGVQLTGVGRRYGTTVAVAGVSLSVPRHGRVAIVGPSGCGKSTLLSVVCGLEEADEGSVSVLGVTSARERLARCAWMPQRDLLLPWRSVLGNVCLPLENRGVAKRSAREQVAPLLARVGLDGVEDWSPSRLSGGMRQRAAFLRTLMGDKEVLLLDEPFGALDSITRGDIQMWLRQVLQVQPRTVLLVTHDVEEAVLLADEVVVLSPRPGQVVETIESRLPEFASRREAVARPEFVAIREAVLSALER